MVIYKNYTGTILLYHGIGQENGGDGSIDRMYKYLKQIFPNAYIDKDILDYGDQNFISVRWNAKKESKRVARIIKKADLVVAHSNGCNYSMKALHRLAMPNTHFSFISPALNRKQPFNRLKFKHIDVYYSPSDWVVWVSKFLIWHPFGNAGQKGFKTDHKDVSQYEIERTSHGEWFDPLSLPTFTQMLADNYMEKYMMSKSELKRLWAQGVN